MGRTVRLPPLCAYLACNGTDFSLLKLLINVLIFECKYLHEDVNLKSYFNLEWYKITWTTIWKWL